MFDELEINLSELLMIFREMGYDDIYIIDPTCRACDPDESDSRRRWMLAFEQIRYESNRDDNSDARNLLNTTMEISTFTRLPSQLGKHARYQSEPLQNTMFNNITVFNMSIATTIALYAIISYVVYSQRGGRKTYKRRKLLKPKNTRNKHRHRNLTRSHYK